mmetsp:Transcript_3662/g.13246  ORF Transcript_3662/g.13246 Transcript_3662/m.13246 type:complete len:209 (-) Transcript_3662:1771-2397(-)
MPATAGSIFPDLRGAGTRASPESLMKPLSEASSIELSSPPPSVYCGPSSPSEPSAFLSLSFLRNLPSRRRAFSRPLSALSAALRSAAMSAYLALTAARNDSPGALTSSMPLLTPSACSGAIDVPSSSNTTRLFAPWPLSLMRNLPFNARFRAISAAFSSALYFLSSSESLSASSPSPSRWLARLTFIKSSSSSSPCSTTKPKRPPPLR